MKNIKYKYAATRDRTRDLQMPDALPTELELYQNKKGKAFFEMHQKWCLFYSWQLRKRHQFWCSSNKYLAYSYLVRALSTYLTIISELDT